MANKTGYTLDNTHAVIDSRDVIRRIEDLESEDARELASLRKLAEQAESSSDWQYGVTYWIRG